jgi:uroporphyrinogen decarboxylase
MLYTQPELLHQLLEKLALSVIDYLNAQILAGAQVVQIFDTWGGALSHSAYLEFSLTYMAKIVDGLIKQADGRDVPVILFTKGGGLWLEAMADTGCDCLGLDWTVDIGAAHQRVGDKVALQGNMDPAILRAKPEVIRGEVKRILGSFGENDGHVFNLGHGITPDINPDNAKIFIDAVHEFSSSN